MSRIKSENPAATTVLVMYRVAITNQSGRDLEAHRGEIDHWFTIEDVLNDSEKRGQLFSLLRI